MSPATVVAAQGYGLQPRELISVFDHIRRVGARTKRHLARFRAAQSVGRHRRPPGAGPVEALASTPARPVGKPLWYPKHGEPLRAEDHVLVRPYMVAHEERVRQWCASRRRTLLIQPYFDMPEAG